MFLPVLHAEIKTLFKYTLAERISKEV